MKIHREVMFLYKLKYSWFLLGMAELSSASTAAPTQYLI